MWPVVCNTYVCIRDKKTARRDRMKVHPVCPVCNKLMNSCPRGVKVPKQKDTKGWENLRAIIIEERLKRRIFSERQNKNLP